MKETVSDHTFDVNEAVNVVGLITTLCLRYKEIVRCSQ